MSNNIITIDFDFTVNKEDIDNAIDNAIDEQECSQYWDKYRDDLACGNIEDGTTYRAYLESIRDKIESDIYSDGDLQDTQYEMNKEDLAYYIKKTFGKDLSDLNWVCSGSGHTWQNRSFENNYKHFDDVVELLQTVSVDGNTKFDIDVDNKILIIKDYHHDCPMGSYTEMKVVDDDVWELMQNEYVTLYGGRKIIDKEEYDKVIWLDNNQRDKRYKRWYGRQMRKINKKIAYLKEKTGLKLEIEREGIYANYNYNLNALTMHYSNIQYYIGHNVNISVKY